MILNKEQLNEEAHKSALSHDPFIRRKPIGRIWRGNKKDIERIRGFINDIRDKQSNCSQPAEEWLLDNAEFIEEQGLVIKQELSNQLINSLPHLNKTGEPRIFSICSDYIKYTDGNLNIDSFISYIEAYQEVSILTIAEVWTLPIMLRVAFIHHLSEITDTLKERVEVCTRVEQLLSTIESSELSPERLNKALEEAGMEIPLSGPLIVHLVRHLQERADYTSTVGEWLICKLENGPESLDHIMSYEYQLQASYQLSTGNLISSLRRLSRIDWYEPFEKISIVEQTLQKESTGEYPRLDFSSRNTLRNKIEKLSRQLNLPENLIASQAVELAHEYVKANDGGDMLVKDLGRQASLAYYLLEGEGLKELRQALKKCGEGKPRALPQVHLLRRSKETYFNMLALFFIITMAVFSLWIGWNNFFSPLQWIAVFLVLSMPAMEWAVTALHWFIERMKQPIPLLRYDFSKEVPEEASSMVVIPVIWSTKEEVDEMVDRLELHYLANRDSNLHFALLGDFKDADSESYKTDEKVIEWAREAIIRLNQSYPKSSFHLFQRKRLWNESERKWMGWERKRGKLVEFVELIKGKTNTSFTIIESDISSLQKIQYIITLDADTQLPLESAHKMIGTMHLPYNRPRLNDKGTIVIEGYGVLQPRIGMSHEGATRSRLGALMSGDPGIDPYAFAISDVYQDGFGQGIFTGKGIFDVDAFYKVLCERIPDNRVLSHDLLEGGFLRAGLLSDIELIDDHPAKFSTFQKRLHRWIRGDWQLLLWLFPKVRNRSGELLPVDLSILTRWQIIDNLRRSLLPPALFIIPLLALTVLPGPPIRWFAIVFITWLLPLFCQLTIVKTAIKHSRSILFTIGHLLFTIVTLPFQSILLLDAIGRTLYRLFISKRKLLEWVTSADVERSNQNKETPAIIGMMGGYLLTLLFLIAAVLSENRSVQTIGFMLVALWAFAPVTVKWLNGPLKRDIVSLSNNEQAELKDLAYQIWSFYDDYVTKEDNWLPPDNVQMDPPKGVAHRTSPTNIGLYLTCVLAARDFEFIDTPQLIERFEHTLDTIEKMDKWEGHLYNWYDTQNLAPLHPKYVSTVDSGNFVGCLITVKEGLIEWLQADQNMESRHHHKNQDQSLHIAFSEELTPILTGDFSQRGENLRDRGLLLLKRMEEIIEDTDFIPLYDHRAKLFSLGYHADRNVRDEVLYDLMASEARQASFIAIALGQVSSAHWHTLGRTMTKVGKHPILLSWSGTMFEYLMPWLFMRTYQNTLWESTYLGVVNRQIKYAEQRGVPFGISESGYYAFDYQMNYQYRAFGVPGLGFKRGLEQDLVVAPYAAILSLPFAKGSALEALKKMEQLHARGKYGYYEAIDFTKQRLPKGKKHMVIRSFMAHHQGMSLLTLSNLLLPKKMYERFHRNKQIKAAELLLQERIPKRPKLIKHPALNRVHEPLEKMIQDVTPMREFLSPHTKVPAVNILSNGKFTTVVTNSGSGFSQYKDSLVSRWREDPVMDPWGSYIYIRDLSNDTFWSPAYQPCQVDSSEQRVQFGLDRATFMRSDGEIKTTMEICVSPEWDAEIRRITLTNTGQEMKVLEVTTFVELALANPIADVAHTAFSKLFIRTDFDPETECLVAGRRPREKKDKTLWAAHSLMINGESLGSLEYDSDRANFIGRGYRLSNPQGIRSRLRNQVGSVADPAFVMRRRVNIKPGEQIGLIAITSVSETKEKAIEIVRRFTPDQTIDRNFQMAWNRVQIELRHLHLTSHEAVEFQNLAGLILYRPPLRKEQEDMILTNKKGQSGLWAFGISGDKPIVLVRIDDPSHMPFVIKMLTGHEYLRRLGLLFDLVFLNESPGGYQQNLQEAIQGAVEHGVDRFGVGSTGIHTIAGSQIAEDDMSLLMAAARVVLRAGRASLMSQLRLPKSRVEEELPDKVVPSTSTYKADARISAAGMEVYKDWLYYNGWGGFSPDGKEYNILIRNGNHLPAPWINVIANRHFGTLISELGTGYTWWRNSRECKLTPWSNDPVLDPPTETAYLRDEASGEVWSAAPSAAQTEAPYKITHGRGYSTFTHERNGIHHEMTVYVPLEDPVKIMKVKLQNHTSSERQISLTYYAEWVLGVQRPANAAHIVTKWLDSASVMTAKNTYQETFREATAFLGMYSNAMILEQTWTGDRDEFIGRNGNMEHPASLDRANLSCRIGTFNETCGAVQTKLTLLPNQEQEVYILLGCEQSEEAVLNLIQKYSQSLNCDQALKDIIDFWDHHLSLIQVKTPSAETDILLNGWLLYQSLSCRMWARTAFYQAGGAYGFRDQLQDSLALLHTFPDMTRRQIMLHASHQYQEGDVQHWWHEETERGIRTKFSDDLLWLPYTVSRYIEHSGDWSILDESQPFLTSEPLQEHEHERYEPTVVAAENGSIYEHSLRALDIALKRIGEHGLPLIGVGDWNDGMNLVGPKGRGESVWLGWFICDVLKRFEDICQTRHDSGKAEEYRAAREGLTHALNEHAWDGSWYRRAFTDEGTWLGTIQNDECQIDAIAQSWSVISGAAPKDRAIQAMNSFDRELVDRDLSVVRLLTPAFDKTEPSPGYIQGYPPGLRENGAQYTHGVIWGIVAWCELGQGDKALEMFNMLNPINHTRTDFEVKKYAGEPYVMAADVYTASPKEGHAGWTWYTGASSWMYQAGIEYILGIRRRGQKLSIKPCIPNDWPEYSVTYRYGKTKYAIQVHNDSKGMNKNFSLTMDGKNISLSEEVPFIDLQDDGQEHEVIIKM